MREREPEHPATPEQIDHGFDEGVGQRPRAPKQRRVGRFSEGVEHDSTSSLRRGRFSDGAEHEDEQSPAERRFSEGVERRRG